jgi:hypothetical protein
LSLNVQALSLAAASSTSAGAVTTGIQTFQGSKSFIQVITGSISGNAATATTAGSAGISNATVAAVTFNNGGSGASSGITFNGGTARTISYNTIGAPSTTGTNASGTWNIGITGNAASVTDGVYRSTSQVITGYKEFRNTSGTRFEQNNNQDGIVILGRAGGTSNYSVTLIPTTLSSNRTLTLPNSSGTVALTSQLPPSGITTTRNWYDASLGQEHNVTITDGVITSWTVT